MNYITIVNCIVKDTTRLAFYELHHHILMFCFTCNLRIKAVNKVISNPFIEI